MNTQQLTDKIDSLLGGEIKALAFGCRVRTKELGLDITDGIVISQDISLFDSADGKGHREVRTKMVFWEKEKFEILGRDPTLADVLRAIDKKRPLPRYWCSVDCEGLFYDLKKDPNRERLNGIQWNLTENLSGQSEECQKFLAKVLGEGMSDSI